MHADSKRHEATLSWRDSWAHVTKSKTMSSRAGGADTTLSVVNMKAGVRTLLLRLFFQRVNRMSGKSNSHGGVGRVVEGCWGAQMLVDRANQSGNVWAPPRKTGARGFRKETSFWLVWRPLGRFRLDLDLIRCWVCFGCGWRPSCRHSGRESVCGGI